MLINQVSNLLIYNHPSKFKKQTNNNNAMDMFIIITISITVTF